MVVLKPAFLDTANHYATLGDHDGQYASLLTFAALDPGDAFTTAELVAATCSHRRMVCTNQRKHW